MVELKELRKVAECYRGRISEQIAGEWLDRKILSKMQRPCW